MKFMCGDRQADAARRVRRGYPIHCYVGKNGSGKSLTCIFDTIPTLEAGRPVLSTVRLVDYENPRPCDGWDYGFRMVGEDPEPCPLINPVTGEHVPDHNQSHPGYIRFTRWEQFATFQRGDVIMDEITGVADSSDHAGMPHDVRNKLPQLRRADVAVRITGLSWARVNKRMRESCQGLTRCVGRLPQPASAEFAQDRIFRPKRMSVARTYDCQTLPVDDITESMYDKCDVVKKGRLWIPESLVSSAYNTFEGVDTVGWADESGACGHCGGARPRRKCSCADHPAQSDAHQRGAPEPGSGATGAGAPAPGLPLHVVPAQA